VTETGSLRDDLLSLLGPWVTLVGTRPYGRVLGALIAEAHTDPAFAEHWKERFVEPRREQGRAILTQAMERGDLPATTDVELALDLLYGPLYHRLLHGHAPLGDRFVRDLVDTVLAGLTAAPAGSG
jgi:AcrR family transcriptional regulator